MFNLFRIRRGRDENAPRLINRRYRLDAYLGGRTRAVHQGVDVETDQQVAIKIESSKTDKHLTEEIKGMKYLQGLSHVPKLFWSGIDREDHVMVMQLLGPSLETVSLGDNTMFDHVTVCMIAIQVIEALKEIHSRGFVHCSLSPKALFLESDYVPTRANGEPSKGTRLYIRKFRLLKSFMQDHTMEFDDEDSNASDVGDKGMPNSKQSTRFKMQLSMKSTGSDQALPERTYTVKQHVHYKEGGRVTGVPRYASVNSHAGLRLTRRDDMESLGYMLIYFAKGKLPWQGLTATSKEAKRALIFSKKISISMEELCDGVPDEIMKLIDHSKSLGFEDAPSYDYLLDIFQKALDTQKYGDANLGMELEPVH